MKKLVLLTLLFVSFYGASSLAQTQKADKKEVRSDVKDSKSEKKYAKGKMDKSSKKDVRSDIKSDKMDKKDAKGK
jgi:Ni/Co efflux regulator RcnB